MACSTNLELSAVSHKNVLCPCIKFFIYQACLVKWLDIGVILFLEHKHRKHELGLPMSSHLDFTHGQYAILLALFWLASLIFLCELKSQTSVSKSEQSQAKTFHQPLLR